MNLWAKLVAIAFAGAAMTLFMPASTFAYQSAPLTFCNNSGAKVGLAVGYHSPGVNDPADHSVLTGPFISRGWYGIEPGACTTIENPFGARYMFWFAFSPQFNADMSAAVAMRNSTASESFCVPNYFAAGKLPDFTYEDENESLAACDRIGADDPTAQASGQGKTLWITPRNTDTWVDATVNFTGQ